MVWPIYSVTLEDDKDFCMPPGQISAVMARSPLEYSSKLHRHSKPGALRLSGIGCTIGTSCSTVPILEKLIENGVNIIRMTMYQSFKREDIMKNIKTACSNVNNRLGIEVPVAVAIDVKGLEIRTGNLAPNFEGSVFLKKGDTIKLTSDKAFLNRGSANCVYVFCDNFSTVVELGHKIYLEQGKIMVICTTIQGSFVVCSIQNNGELQSWSEVILPETKVDYLALTTDAKSNIIFGIEQNVDLIILSTVRDPRIINEARDIIKSYNSTIQIIAKIEDEAAVNNINEIIQAADGILIARGHVGMEITQQKMFLAQKSIIAKCNRAGKPVSVITQFISSMIKKVYPRCHEVLDIANCVMDGVDSFILSYESASGDHPIQVVRMLSKICQEAEASVWYKRNLTEAVRSFLPPVETSLATAISVVIAATYSIAAAIICITGSGHSAQLIAMLHPQCPIITVTRNRGVARILHLHRGVLPLHYNQPQLPVYHEEIQNRINFAIDFGKWKNIIKAGDVIVAVCGTRTGKGHANTIRIEYILQPVEEYDCKFEINT